MKYLFNFFSYLIVLEFVLKGVVDVKFLIFYCFFLFDFVKVFEIVLLYDIKVVKVIIECG